MFHDGSNLGFQVATLPSGRLFGELALMNDQPRTASIKCMSDCQFLAIPRKDFDAVLKAEMLRKKEEKLSFLKAHCPGMMDLPPPRLGRPPAAYFFHHATYLKGHAFLTQGLRGDGSVIIVASGAVAFMHRDPEAPRLKPEDAGYVPSSVGTGPQKGPRHSRREGWATANAFRRIGVLVAGGLFGTLPTSDPEPFTVQVISPSCEVHYVSVADWLRLPKKLTTAMQEYLVHSATCRLNRCLETRAAVAQLAQIRALGKLTTLDVLRKEAGFQELVTELPINVPRKARMINCDMVARCEAKPPSCDAAARGQAAATAERTPAGRPHSAVLHMGGLPSPTARPRAASSGALRPQASPDAPAPRPMSAARRALVRPGSPGGVTRVARVLAPR